MSTEWRRVIGGLMLVMGLLAAITLALFVTHPCGRLGVDEFATCGAIVPAVIVAAVTLAASLPLLLAGRKRH